MFGSENIDEVRLIRDPAGRLKGFCYVQFYERERCTNAIEKYNKVELKGKHLNISMTLSRDDLHSSL